MPTVVQQLCDVHYASDETAEGVAITLKIGGLERVVILCDDHRCEIVGPVETLMHEHGAKPEPVKPQPHTSAAGYGKMPLPAGVTRDQALAMVEAVQCIFDPSHGPFGNRAGLSSHMRSQHNGASLTALGLGLRGTPIERAARTPEGFACGTCDRTFPTRQGVATHRARKHGTYAESTTARRKRAARGVHADAVA